jgi:hypothetical protein
MPQKPTTLIIACGALAAELLALQKRTQWAHLRIHCLPAKLHDTPGRIPGAVRSAVQRHRDAYEQVFVAYADCGTGGRLDAVLGELGVERLPGAHCYDFYSGEERFRELAEEEPGTFYLTDFLARHFDRLVRQGLGLDRHPQLRQQYFGNYRRVVLLSQSPAPALTALARSHARYLGLDFVEHPTGLDPLELALKQAIAACPN